DVDAPALIRDVRGVPHLALGHPRAPLHPDPVARIDRVARTVDVSGDVFGAHLQPAQDMIVKDDPVRAAVPGLEIALETDVALGDPLTAELGGDAVGPAPRRGRRFGTHGHLPAVSRRPLYAVSVHPSTCAPRGTGN